jgi:hypothetical protein
MQSLLLSMDRFVSLAMTIFKKAPPYVTSFLAMTEFVVRFAPQPVKRQ